MFGKNRYITVGVHHEIDLELQLILWALIDDLKALQVDQMDYLQVFDLEVIKLENGKSIQRITHCQECPWYKKVHHVNVTKPINEKIYTIDSGQYSIMMLATEY